VLRTAISGYFTLLCGVVLWFQFLAVMFDEHVVLQLFIVAIGRFFKFLGCVFLVRHLLMFVYV